MESLRRDIEKCSSKSLDGFEIYSIYSQNGKVLRDGFPYQKHLEKRLSLACQEAFGETPKIFIWTGDTMQIFIETLAGKTTTFLIRPTATIRLLKERIELKEGVPANQHHLIFAGNQLDPGWCNQTSKSVNISTDPAFN
jgi:Ubiquitin family